jgi:hypothetical protein
MAVALIVVFCTITPYDKPIFLYVIASEKKKVPEVEMKDSL